MRKIILTKEQVEFILRMYNEELLGSHSISMKLNISKSIVLRTLKENNVILRPPGRRDIGGKKVADKKWRDKNKKYVSEIYKNWSEKNKERLKEYQKKWRDENRDKLRKTKRNYEKTRKHNDPLYKLIANFRTAICQVLKENNVQKNGHYFEILQYTPNELINHLEKQFTENMTWDNYGEWHVDHIKPITFFKINEIGDDEFMKCWSLNNLQPMWGHENISKSNKV